MSPAGPTDPIAQALAASPALFPYALNPRTGAVTLVRLAEADFERASFLDERLHASGRPLPWAQVAAAAEDLAERCDFIFHIGHVGSTLLSRLLGAHPGIFSLREPQILRTLAQLHAEPEVAGGRPGDAEVRIPVVLRLLSRTFAPDQTALVKATSYVSELAACLLARPYAPRAILMTVQPERFLATILGAENSPAEARMLAPSRLKRLHRRLGSTRWRLDALSPGELVALGWACEMTALADAAVSAGGRAQWHDFDGFLAGPRAGLFRCLNHLGVAASDSEIGAILAGPDMRRYAKAPEHAYDSALRDSLLNEAHIRAGDEINRGMRWLEAAAAEFPQIRAALEISPAE